MNALPWGILDGWLRADGAERSERYGTRDVIADVELARFAPTPEATVVALPAACADCASATESSAA